MKSAIYLAFQTNNLKTYLNQKTTKVLLMTKYIQLKKI